MGSAPAASSTVGRPRRILDAAAFDPDTAHRGGSRQGDATGPEDRGSIRPHPVRTTRSPDRSDGSMIDGDHSTSQCPEFLTNLTVDRGPQSPIRPGGRSCDRTGAWTPPRNLTIGPAVWVADVASSPASTAAAVRRSPAPGPPPARSSPSSRGGSSGEERRQGRCGLLDDPPHAPMPATTRDSPSDPAHVLRLRATGDEAEGSLCRGPECGRLERWPPTPHPAGHPPSHRPRRWS